MARRPSFSQADSCMPVSVLSLQKKKTTRRAFSEGQVTRRTNPARSARPPEKFALENFTVSAAKFAEEFYSFRRRKTVSGVFYDYNEPMLLCLSQWSSCGSVHHGLLGLGEGAKGLTREVCRSWDGQAPWCPGCSCGHTWVRTPGFELVLGLSSKPLGLSSA